MATAKFSSQQVITYALVAVCLVLADPARTTFMIGAGLGAVGILIRVWACGHLRKNRQVSTSGPYAYVRDPLYLGTLIIAIGATLAAGSPEMPGLLIWTVIGPGFILAFFGRYMPRKSSIEGQRLERRFGEEFTVYRDAVPSLIPSLKRYPKAGNERWSLSVFRGNGEIQMDALIVGLYAVFLIAPGSLIGL